MQCPVAAAWVVLKTYSCGFKNIEKVFASSEVGRQAFRFAIVS